jgi:hypothetical protein
VVGVVACVSVVAVSVVAEPLLSSSPQPAPIRAAAATARRTTSLDLRALIGATS